MKAREMASAYRLEQWAQRIRDQKASGQSIQAWCDANGIHRQRYFYWQRKLRALACEQLAGVTDGMETKLAVASGFTQVQVNAASIMPTPLGAQPGGQVGIETGGVQITADSGYPVEQLTVLVRELSGQC
jgi:putative transposase